MDTLIVERLKVNVACSGGDKWWWWWWWWRQQQCFTSFIKVLHNRSNAHCRQAL